MPDNFDRHWETIAHDYNSPVLRNYVWTLCEFGFKKYLDVPVFYIAIISENDNIHYLTDMKTWIATHEGLKAKCLADNAYFENLIDQTCEIGEENNSWARKTIAQQDMGSLSNSELADIVDGFVERQSKLYTYGVAIPVMDFGDFSFVESNLKQILSAKVAGDKYDDYYRIFTHPLYNSYAQDQEEELLHLMKKYYADEGWKQAVLGGELEKLKNEYPDFALDLENHVEKHGWIYYVYAGPAFDAEKFLGFIQDYLKKNTDPSEKLEHISEQKKQTLLLREEYIAEIRPNNFDEMIIRLAGKVVWAKPRRKDYQSYFYSHIEKVMREIGKRLGLSLRQARTIPPSMIREILKKGHVDINYLNSLYKLHVCLPNDDGTVAVYEGKKAEEFVSKHYHQAEAAADQSISELKGSCACRGKAKGTVRVINWSNDMHKMQDGDILVSIATTPAIVPSMRKAAAIVTDEGGLTCHAAIVSRELNIPCVVGTKIATQVFKDGDIVEVNATNGVIRKIDHE